MSLQSVVKHINPSVLHRLYRYGYCVIDNAVDEKLINNLCSELKALQEFEILYKCHTHINLQNEKKLISKSNVWELELHSYPELQSICTDLWSVLNDTSLCKLFTNYNYTHQTLKVLYSQNN